MSTLVSNVDGRLYMASQVQDYALRGLSFAQFNYLDYMVETYEIRKGDGDEEREEAADGVTHRVGRARNPRDSYLSDHPKVKSHIRIQRAEHHNYLPNIIGLWFPRRDRLEEEDFYYASMLALLRPWRALEDLKRNDRSWKEEGLLFLESATAEQRNVIACMQYYYDSKVKAQNRNQDVDEDKDVEHEYENMAVNEADDDRSTMEKEVRVLIHITSMTGMTANNRKPLY